jgi:hypothetical protein
MAVTGRALMTGVLVAASLVATGCGKSEDPTILNTEKVERAIERSSLDQRNANPRVSCPSGVHQKKGSAFSCTAIVKHTATRFVVTQIDDDGHVRYEGR